MRQHAADLCTSASAFDAGHEPCKGGRGVRPFRRPAFIEAAEIDELNIKPADRFGFNEHLALDLKSTIPGRLAAHRGIHREYQPAALPGLPPGRRYGVHLA